MTPAITKAIQALEAASECLEDETTGRPAYSCRHFPSDVLKQVSAALSALRSDTDTGNLVSADGQGRTTDALGWQPIETAPRDGRLLLMTDGENIHVCYPKRFPRPLDQMATPEDAAASKAGDVWEYFRDEDHAPGHSWSMVPTHWKPLPPPPVVKVGA